MEGFDVTSIQDPLYFFLKGEYVPLTKVRKNKGNLLFPKFLYFILESRNFSWFYVPACLLLSTVNTAILLLWHKDTMADKLACNCRQNFPEITNDGNA